jgi:hypothetical protein
MIFLSARYAMHINPLKGDPAIILAGKENFACQSRIPAYSYLAAQWNRVSTLQKNYACIFLKEHDYISQVRSAEPL